VRVSVVAALGVAAVVAGCASSPPSPPPPIAFIGELDVSRPGIDFLITDAAGTLKCSAHSTSGKLPAALSLPLTCEDGQTGTLNVTKAPDLRGAVIFSNGTTGEVTFAALPAPPPIAVASPPPPPPVVVSSPVPVRTYRTYSRARYSTGYVRPHYRRSTYVRGYYRNGHYVSGHTRRGSHVRGHYRRR
jgi:hypothetical protein